MRAETAGVFLDLSASRRSSIVCVMSALPLWFLIFSFICEFVKAFNCDLSPIRKCCVRDIAAELTHFWLVYLISNLTDKSLKPILKTLNVAPDNVPSETPHLWNHSEVAGRRTGCPNSTTVAPESRICIQKVRKRYLSSLNNHKM